MTSVGVGSNNYHLGSLIKNDFLCTHFDEFQRDFDTIAPG